VKEWFRVCFPAPAHRSEDGRHRDRRHRQQTEASLDNLKATLEAAGSSLDKVVKVTIFAANSAYYGTINKVYARYFSQDPAARTFVTVASAAHGVRHRDRGIALA
jgi:enamine deaminase RidA (YjgF/YER057c/UK114 family)